MASALAHTRNSSGRIGVFVDPYGCSCSTCMEEVAAPPMWPGPHALGRTAAGSYPADAAGTILPQRSLCTGIDRDATDVVPVGRTPCCDLEAVAAAPTPARSSAKPLGLTSFLVPPLNQKWFGSKWVPSSSSVPSLPPPPPLKRTRAYGSAESSLASPIGAGWLSRMLSQSATKSDEEQFMEQISVLRQKLLREKATLNDDGDAQEKKLEKKIQALTSVLTAFA